MKKMVIALWTMMNIIAINAEEHNLPQSYLTMLQAKSTYLEEHDKLKLLPRMRAICGQLQEICRDSQEVCKGRKLALDREITILTQLYLKQLLPHELTELKALIKQLHNLRGTIFNDPALRQQCAQRQKEYIEVLFI